MTIKCPWVTCNHNTENEKPQNEKPQKEWDVHAGQCKLEDIELTTPTESTEFKDVDWGQIEPDDLLICETYQRNW